MRQSRNRGRSQLRPAPDHARRLDDGDDIRKTVDQRVYQQPRRRVEGARRDLDHVSSFATIRLTNGENFPTGSSNLRGGLGHVVVV